MNRQFNNHDIILYLDSKQENRLYPLLKCAQHKMVLGVSDHPPDYFHWIPKQFNHNDPVILKQLEKLQTYHNNKDKCTDIDVFITDSEFFKLLKNPLVEKREEYKVRWHVFSSDPDMLHRYDFNKLVIGPNMRRIIVKQILVDLGYRIIAQLAESPLYDDKIIYVDLKEKWAEFISI